MKPYAVDKIFSLDGSDPWEFYEALTGVLVLPTECEISIWKDGGDMAFYRRMHPNGMESGCRYPEVVENGYGLPYLIRSSSFEVVFFWEIHNPDGSDSELTRVSLSFSALGSWKTARDVLNEMQARNCSRVGVHIIGVLDSLSPSGWRELSSTQALNALREREDLLQCAHLDPFDPTPEAVKLITAFYSVCTHVPGVEVMPDLLIRHYGEFWIALREWDAANREEADPH